MTTCWKVSVWANHEPIKARHCVQLTTQHCIDHSPLDHSRVHSTAPDLVHFNSNSNLANSKLQREASTQIWNLFDKTNTHTRLIFSKTNRQSHFATILTLQHQKIFNHQQILVRSLLPPKESQAAYRKISKSNITDQWLTTPGPSRSNHQIEYITEDVFGHFSILLFLQWRSRNHAHDTSQAAATAKITIHSHTKIGHDKSSFFRNDWEYISYFQ